MEANTIHKSTGPVPPNLPDHALVSEVFSWEGAGLWLDGMPDGGLNIAHEAVDRHAEGPRADRVALRWLGTDDTPRELTYAELRDRTNAFANLLCGLGVGPGDVVASLLGRVPELYVAALGTLKHRAVFCPVSSALGPEAVQTRLVRGHAEVLLVTARQYEQEIAAIRASLPELRHVLVLTEAGVPEDTLALDTMLERCSTHYTIGSTPPETPALLHFTHGRNGAPKGALHVHHAAVAHHMTGRYALDLHDGDVYWCTADPGRATGTSYGIIAPLMCGVTLVFDEAELEARRCYRILEEQGVTVWYTAPTAIRMLMEAGADLAQGADLSHLRFIASFGAPLEPEATRWGARVLGLPIHDGWSQTEAGGIMIANFAALDIKPGSMGLPLPGIDAAIVQRTDDGHVEIVAAPDIEGELALRAGWPSMFRDYLGDRPRYEARFADGWYLTGDRARRDADGYYWFVVRADDPAEPADRLSGPRGAEPIVADALGTMGLRATRRSASS